MTDKTKKKVYFIGIAGKTMAPLAKAFKDMGWGVSGSDHQGIYPPISTYLKENRLSYIEGYAAENVPSGADLIVVGRSALMVDPNNPEYLKAKTLGCPVLSHPETLRDFLIKPNSIVVAGTYGKTTISAIVSWILIKAGIDPAYMISGVPLNMKDGVKFTDSQYSVVEGDEPPSMRETDPPKFMFYRPKFLVLTATKWDHPEIYKTPEDYLKAFVELVKLLPKEGFLVYNLDNVAPELLSSCPCRAVSYSLTNQAADYFVQNISSGEEVTDFEVQTPREAISLKTILLGEHNLENLCASVALARELKVEVEKIKNAIEDFKGVKTRLEFLGKIGGRFLYWDLAQHPEKVKGSLLAIRQHYPGNKVICVFDPAATALKYRESLAWYPGAFDQADRIVVGKVSFLKNVSGKERVSGKDIVEAIAKTQKNVFYEPIDEKIVEDLVNKTASGEVIVFMSSGGLRFSNLIEEVIQKVKEAGV